MFYYCGIGSRNTPTIVLNGMKLAGGQLARLDYVLRSGHAPGADQWFERGCDIIGGQKEIFIPWKGFEGSKDGIVPRFTDELMSIAENYHPAWDACSEGARKLHARNVCQILGANLDSPVDFVICWTSDGKASGGTGQAIRIAEDYDIPVYNLFGNEDLMILRGILFP
jgi:hypothetical protein